jgi:hypothetical protein
MSHGLPAILLVTDSAPFRRYLRSTFEQASWQVRDWDPRAGEDPGEPACASLTAALAEWRLGESQVSGLQVLTAIRHHSRAVICVLYAIQAGKEEWRLASEDAIGAGIIPVRHGSVTPASLYEQVAAEVRRSRGDVGMPRQSWEDAEAWIQPSIDSAEPQLAQAIEAVGRRHLLPIIKELFPERGPHHPIRYSFVSPGFSGARAFLLQDPLGTERPGPRYILKVAQGEDGYRALREERHRFHRSILGGGLPGQRLKGYVAEELRPGPRQPDLVEANDWFGIAYREVGNGVGRILSLRDHYLEVEEPDQEASRYRLLARFLDRLYSDCLGPSCHHRARLVTRKLWSDGSTGGACYSLPATKKYAIFAALDELRPRAMNLLRRDPTDEIYAFIEKGRCGRRLLEPTLFHREFRVLEAGTHGDLHAGNILAIDRQGDLDPFLIDFSEYEEQGHPFYDYARLENDVRLRLMNYEDGSDILNALLDDWLNREERLQLLLEDPKLAEPEPPVLTGKEGFAAKGYWLMDRIRWLSHQNLAVRLTEPRNQPSPESFTAQYISALLHRTLISLASTDIVTEKKVLALWLASRLIARLGTIVGSVAA